MKIGAREASGTNDRLYIVLVCASAIGAYLAVPGFQFVFDDRGQILGNASLLHVSSIPAYFRSYVWGQVSGVAHSYYRPLFFTWLNLNYSLFGLHAAAWHVALLGLHLLTSVLVFIVVRNVFRNSTTGALAAVLFAVHPTHAESVAWVSGAPDPLAAVFVLASFIFYKKTQGQQGGIRSLSALVSLTCFACALLSKEAALLFPFVLLADLMLSKPSSRPSWKFPLIISYFLLAAGYLAVRLRVLGVFAQPHTDVSWPVIFLTLPSVVLFYLRILIFPVGLSPFYETGYVQRADLMHFWIPVLLLVAAGTLTFVLVSRVTVTSGSQSNEKRACAFFALWTVLFLMPALDLPALDPGEFAHDRYLYLPSIGFLAIIAFLLQQIAARVALPKRWQILAFASFVLVLGSATVAQSYYWKNDLALYRRGVDIAPANVNALNNLASAYLEAGDYDRGIRLHQQILEKHSNYAASYYNIGLAYYNQSNFSLAENYLRKAVQLRAIGDWYFYLGLAEFKNGQVDQAVESLRQAVRQEPFQPQFHTALGIVLESQGHVDLAIQELESAQKLNPANTVIQNEIARLKTQLKP